MDLGKIKITSHLSNIEGKWSSNPKKKTFVNIMDIDMNRVRIDFDSKSITPPFDMNISIERINYSDILLDGFLSQGINFSDFNKEDVVSIKCTPFEINIKKEVYTYFLRVLDLNINYYDDFEERY